MDMTTRVFSKWESRPDELLTYDVAKDRLIGTQVYNKDYVSHIERFFRRISVANEDLRIPALADEIKRLQRRIRYEEQHHITLSDKERSIAILVRENWQAEMVRSECAKLLPGVTIQTNTGGDLYMSQPAIDMMTLVNALVHFDEAEYLYNLVTSNFFNLNVPRSNLYEIRMKIKAGGWRAKIDEREQVNYLIKTMNQMLANMDDKVNTWEKAVASLRVKPVLQVIRQIYTYLEPWKNFSDDEWKQHYYQLNVDLLFEQLINACNVDRLTINTLQERLYNCIVSQVSVDSRIPSSKKESAVQIQCITVHKAKGLEYGHVIVPFCSASMNSVKQSQLHISTAKDGARYRIGYSLHIPDAGVTLQKDDITGWFTKGEPLKFDADYRGWLRTFIKGTDHPSSAQPGAIDWQDIGIPAYIAETRLSDLAGYYIDDQKTPTNREIIVFMDRSAESRDVLLALNEWNYAKGWEFEGAVYYQQRLITWLERRKTQIVEKVTATKTGEPNVPVLEWCLALQYLKSCILGHKVNTESIYTTVTSLFDKFNKDDMIVRETSEWNDLIQFVQHKEAEFDSASLTICLTSVPRYPDRTL